MIINDLNIAASALKRGELVAFPTETVYGLGADARNPAAVAKVFTLKGRPNDHPLIVHLSDAQQMIDWAREIPDEAWHLARQLWPGPLTLVLKKHPSVDTIVTGGQDTIGLRVPSHPIAQSLLQAFGSGLAAPSANKFTRISPTNAQAVEEEFGDAVVTLEGGNSEVGVESTIINLTSATPELLRPGMLSVESIETSLGKPIVAYQSAVKAPGMHALHYAPRTTTYLVEQSQLQQFFASRNNEEPIALITTTAVAVQKNVDVILMPNSPEGYAKMLYRTLRELDRNGYRKIVIMQIPKEHTWDAIRDRVSKASLQSRIDG